MAVGQRESFRRILSGLFYPVGAVVLLQTRANRIITKPAPRVLVSVVAQRAESSSFMIARNLKGSHLSPEEEE